MTRRAYRGTERHIDRYAHTASTFTTAQREAWAVEERRLALEGIAELRAGQPDPDLGDMCVPDEDMRQAIDFAGYFWSFAAGLLLGAPIVAAPLIRWVTG